MSAKSLPIPEQVHLSLADDPYSMTVQWVTIDSSPNASLVEYGRSKQKLNLSARANTTVFEYDGSVRFMHTAVLKYLSPGSVYYYRVGSTAAFSRIFDFRTFPAGDNISYRVCIFGDLGVDNGVSIVHLQREAERRQFDLIVHVGDIAYDLHRNNGTVGDTFMRFMEPIISTIPYMVIAGNHEEDGKNFSHYRNRFKMPNSPFNDNQVYSFDLGPVHFVGASTEYYGFFDKYGHESVLRQYEWLRKDLAKARLNKKRRPWVIGYQHRPFYCSNTNSFECAAFENSLIRTGYEDMRGLEDLFVEYGMDLGFWGHEHSYERFYPISRRIVYNLTDDPYYNALAPTYIITGSAGCHTPHADFSKNPAPGSAVRSSDYGYTILHVLNKTHLFIEQISVETGPRQIDSFWLRKDPGFTPTNIKARLKRGVPFPNVVEQQTCDAKDPRCRERREKFKTSA